MPGKYHGQRSLVGYSPWGRKVSDTTEQLHFHFSLSCIGEENWQPTPVFLPGESQGWQSLVGFRLWGCTESDKTEVTAAAAVAAAAAAKLIKTDGKLKDPGMLQLRAVFAFKSVIKYSEKRI